MRNLLAFLGAAILTVLVVGWYLGWYDISREPSTAGHSKLGVDINSDKIGSDVKQGEQKVEDFLEKNAPANPTPNSPAQPVGPDAKPKQSSQRAEDALKNLVIDEVFPQDKSK